ncbi:gamma-glutamyl-gamma-aminobutyrate hydrolase family protein [Undibacterium sp. TJN19]|uniref:gamma-glutamyl-gamma-aminobutyrate hydrolase family protein n=1 Tax=Undibacterium sp. TJN19 TaxID=3413055 RepID=UPI003BF3B390
MSKPVIGITPDRNDEATSIESHFFVRRNYCAAIADCGAIPFVLPYQLDLIDQYLDLVDGIVLTGGMFDIHPHLYGGNQANTAAMCLKSDRTEFELALLRGALARDMPVLGICGGMQLIAVEMGAQLFQHLPADVDSHIEHKQNMPCDLPAHRIRLMPDSRLHKMLGVDECMVNSLHHQAVISGNHQLRVGAVADDGVIEAIEAINHTFCVGVQWHPEYQVNAAERSLFAELVRAAKP